MCHRFKSYSGQINRNVILYTIYNRPISPHLSIYNSQISSLLSIFHRFSGLFLFLNFISFFLFYELYLSYQLFFIYNYFWLYLLGVSVYIYHLLNGIRCILMSFGFLTNLKFLKVFKILVIFLFIILNLVYIICF